MRPEKIKAEIKTKTHLLGIPVGGHGSGPVQLLGPGARPAPPLSSVVLRTGMRFGRGQGAGAPRLTGPQGGQVLEPCHRSAGSGGRPVGRLAAAGHEHHGGS